MGEVLEWEALREESAEVHQQMLEDGNPVFSGALGEALSEFKSRGRKVFFPVAGLAVSGIKNLHLRLKGPREDCGVFLTGQRLGSTMNVAQSGVIVNTRCSDYPFPVHRPDINHFRTALRGQRVADTLRTIKDYINTILPREMCWESDIACFYISRGYYPVGLTDCRYINFDPEKTQALSEEQRSEIESFLREAHKAGVRKNFRKRIVFEFNPQKAGSFYERIKSAN